MGLVDPLLSEGLEELTSFISALNKLCFKNVQVEANLGIARGLDYYTVLVFETKMVGFESLDSICSDGRYDSLGSGSKSSYPGMGISLVITRMLIPLLKKGLLSVSKATPLLVLVALPSEKDRSLCDGIVRQLRSRGISCEVSSTSEKYGKQIVSAQKRGIPYVWFPAPSTASGVCEVRDLRSRVQKETDVSTWIPSAKDLQTSFCN